jgi:hypothetical protein
MSRVNKYRGIHIHVSPNILTEDGFADIWQMKTISIHQN